MAEGRRRHTRLLAAALALLLHGLAAFWWLRPAGPERPPGPARGPVMQARWLNPPPTRDTATPARPARAPAPPGSPRPPAPAPRPAAVASALEARIDTAPSTAPPSGPAAAAPSSPDIAPLALSPEALAEGLRRERQWQARQGRPRPPLDRGPGRDAGAEAGTTVLQESTRADGSRLARVQGPLGTYCLRLPPPGSPLPEGPGPRLALPGNCP